MAKSSNKFLFWKKDVETIDLKEHKEVLESLRDANKTIARRDSEIQSMNREIETLKERNDDLETYMTEHIEGKRLGEYDKPAIIKLRDNLELRMKALDKREADIKAREDKVEQDLKEGRMKYEIELATEYSRKKDEIMNLLVTKAPIQNLLVDRNTGHAQEVGQYGSATGPQW